jgi:DNA-binding protein H-NS
MPIDLNTLSAKELESLISKAKKRKTTLNKRKPLAQVRKKLTQQAKAEGYTIAELFGTGSGAATATRAPRGTAKKARKSLGKVPPKYRDPANPENTWTGRGKQPRWLAAYTGNGRNVDEFLIK